mgnify:CR=1 FL=1
MRVIILGQQNNQVSYSMTELAAGFKKFSDPKAPVTGGIFDLWKKVDKEGMRWDTNFLSALNGFFGDELKNQNSDLQIQMGFYLENKKIELSKRSLLAQYDAGSKKLVIFLHGLMDNELMWDFSGIRGTNYGSLLKEDQGMTPFFVRYNSGLHISDNGKSFSRMMDELLRNYHSDVDQIILVGHSMGGLIARSACYQADKLGHYWVDKVKKVFLLGSPSLGAPLEKLVNIISWGSRKTFNPLGKSVSDLLNCRSDGIKDLRFGYLLEEDWLGKDPDALMENNRTNIPLLSHAEHFIIVGTLFTHSQKKLSAYIGDAIVTKKSAQGSHRKKCQSIPFKEENIKIFNRIGHTKLAYHPLVYRQLELWCRS